MKYFPPSKNTKFRSDINNLQQFAGEAGSELWETFKGFCQNDHIMVYLGVFRLSPIIVG